jgi:hypothetical protein
MPDTPIYGITYPCVTSPVNPADFEALAADTEAALAVLDAEATSVTHLPNARAFGDALPAFGVEATLTYLTFPTLNTSAGITFNAAAGTFTIITPGIYSASVRNIGPGSGSLTITSQRIAVAVNGTNRVIRKYRGFNPPDPGVLAGSYSCDISCLAGDVVTFRFLWTGTGVLLSGEQAYVSLDLLATP